MISKLVYAQNKPVVKENCVIVTNKNSKRKPMEISQKNVLGTDLKLASIDPITGFFRTGFCATDQNDRGVHVVAAVVTDEFLKYSLSKGQKIQCTNRHLHEMVFCTSINPETGP